MDLGKQHYIAIQPYDRNPQFFNLADFRMKEVLENHYKTIEKHSEKLSIETIYALGMGPSEYVQIVRFKPEDLVLFHEFMNDLTKINSPFMSLKETVIGIADANNPQKRTFANQKRLTSIIYASYPPGWWNIDKKKKDSILKQHEALAKEYEKSVDANTAQLLGLSSPELIMTFEYPFENAQTYSRLLNEIIKNDAPYLEINQTFTGIAGIGDYWLEQLQDIEIKDISMSEFTQKRWGQAREA